MRSQNITDLGQRRMDDVSWGQEVGAAFVIPALFLEPGGRGKVGQSGLDPGRVTMIRLICAALALTCLSAPAFAETCIASRYGYSGGKTASGERMNPDAMTAAHRARPFGSHVTVTSHSTGRSVTVRINDRGPFVKGRCIDLSTGAARVLGFAGTTKVSLEN
jgi:rare lipoprotein A